MARHVKNKFIFIAGCQLLGMGGGAKAIIRKTSGT